MAVRGGAGWHGVGFREWGDLALIRARLADGADPHAEVKVYGRPLHAAAANGSPEVIAELAARVDDVDAEYDGRTALWQAVYADRPDNARALVAAGAEPWRPMMSGWSPGRLSLAGPTPDLFADGPGAAASLTPEEAAEVTEGRRLAAAFSGLRYDGTGLACVAGVDAAEAARRLDARPIASSRPGAAEWEPWPFPGVEFESLEIVGATDVPGGCVITQPWGYQPSTPGVVTRLSRGTVCYGLYANPKSGDQGSITRDGRTAGWDLHPGGPPWSDDPSREVLASYLFRYSAAAYSCFYVGLRPPDARCVAGPPDVWLRLPPRDYWRRDG